MKIIWQFKYLWLLKLSGMKQLITCDVGEACGCSLHPELGWQRVSEELPVPDTETCHGSAVTESRAAARSHPDRPDDP